MDFLRIVLDKMVEKFDHYAYPTYNKLRYYGFAILFGFCVIYDAARMVVSSLKSLADNTEAYTITLGGILGDAFRAAFVILLFDVIINVIDAYLSTRD